jgi:hypothetical protein
MIGPDTDVNPRIEKTGGVAGEVVALRLASCGAVIRPRRSLALSQLAKGGFPARPLASPRNRACRRCTLPRSLAPWTRVGGVAPPHPLTRSFRPWTLTNPRRFGCAPRREPRP